MFYLFEVLRNWKLSWGPSFLRFGGLVTDTFSSIYCPGGYTLNAILEPIGIAFLEDIFSALERARKRFAAWMFNIEG